VIPDLIRGSNYWRSLVGSSQGLAVLAGNLIPLVGVLFFRWDAFYVVAIYWFENVIVGAFSILKILLASGSLESTASELASRFLPHVFPELTRMAMPKTRHSSFAIHGGKVLMVPFFLVHYGVFTIVHGVFVVALLGPQGIRAGMTLGPLLGVVTTAAGVVAAVSLAAEHGYLFFTQYVRGGEYRRTAPALQMGAPYPRIIVLHLALLVGGFGAVTTGARAPIVVLLVLLKVGLELTLLGSRPAYSAAANNRR
jgi:hypothetical protein